VEVQHVVARVRPLELRLTGMNLHAARHALVVLETCATENATRHNGRKHTRFDQTLQTRADDSYQPETERPRRRESGEDGSSLPEGNSKEIGCRAPNPAHASGCGWRRAIEWQRWRSSRPTCERA
jgi:hypothetical protein